MRISRSQLDEIFDHAREEAPNECCGFASAKEGRVQEVFRAENIRHSPYGFEFGFEALRAANDLEDDGFDVVTYHSHPRSEPEPSVQDVNVAQYPEWLYVIVSLRNEDDPEIRAWRIVDSDVSEEDIVVE
jgi:proteasome lid subunit RPN8/RPN11